VIDDDDPRTAPCIDTRWFALAVVVVFLIEVAAGIGLWLALKFAVGWVLTAWAALWLLIHFP
jgi:membrane protein YdbS with pleckstrin-like domain